MLYIVSILIILGIALALAVALAIRSKFQADLAALEKAVQAPSPVPLRDGQSPPAVVALAARHGVTRPSAVAARFTQAGTMWSAPRGRPMHFKAHQVTAANRSAFLWAASFKPRGAIIAADFLTARLTGLRVRLLGVFSLVNAVQSPEIRRGQRLRYLAELPWVPDAMLINPEIDWTAVGDSRLVAGLGKGQDRVELMFTLGDDGLIATATCAARPRLEDGQLRNRPWGGRFWAYQEFEGRMIPTWAEVHWVIDGERFVYWTGHIESWTSR